MGSATSWLLIAAFSASLGTVAVLGLEGQEVPRPARNGDRPVQPQHRADIAGATAPDPDGTTPLHHAVRSRDVRRVAALVRSGANVNAANRYGVTPLSLAATNGDAAMTDVLLTAGADPNATFGAGETVLMTAARSGAVDVLKALIAHGARVNAKESWLGETALMWAAAEDHAAAVQLLVKAGADLNARSARTDFPEQKFTIAGMLTTYLNRGEWTPLMYAARQGALDGARALVEAGADLNASDPDGTTPLVLAIINTHFDLAAMLLEKGANPNITDESGMGALYAAIDMHTLDEGYGRPTLKSTDTADAAGLTNALLTHGADPNARLKSPTIQRHHNVGNPALGAGTTPLIRAAKNGDIALVRLLMAHGATPDLTLADGTNALMAAIASPVGQFTKSARIEKGTGEVVALFLDLGMDVNAMNDRGQTVVHMAASQGFDDIIRTLAKHGAPLDTKDKRGLTPLDIAMGAGGRRGAPPKPTTVALLRELTAK